MPVSEDVPAIPVPETFPPHPRLYLNPTEIDALKANVTTHAWLGEFVEGFLADFRTRMADGIELPTTEWDEKKNVEVAKHAAEYALAYLLTDDEVFAKAAAEILLSFVPLFPTFEVTLMKGRATSAALSEAGWAINMCMAYDWIYNAGILSDSDKLAIEQEVLKQSAEVMRICNHPFRSNWRNRAMSGFGTVGFCIEDRELIDEALNGICDDTGTLIRDGFARQLAEAILADGVYYERTIGYHFAVLGNYAELMEAARHSGVNLWHLERMSHPGDVGADRERLFGDGGMKTIQALYEIPFHYVFSDMSKAAVANAKADKIHREWFFQPAWREYGDPRFAWIMNQPKEAGDGRVVDPLDLVHLIVDMPEGEFDLAVDRKVGLTGQHANTCTMLPNGGYTVLRESTDPNATNVLMTYGKYGSGHSHPDKLSIVVCRDGKHVLPEVNYFGYGDPDFLTWNNQTLAHNTVTVDEVAQHPQADGDEPWVADWDFPVYGEPVFFHPGEHAKIFRGACKTVYDGVVQTRTLAMIDGMIVDFFHSASETERQYDYVMHVDGELADCSVELGEVDPGPLSKAYGYNHVVDIRRTMLNDGAVSLAYTVAEGKPAMKLDVLAGQDAEFLTAMGNSKEEDYPALPMLMLRSKGTCSDFAAVMQFGDEDVTVATMTDLPAGWQGVGLLHADGRKDLAVCSLEAASLSLAGQEITGRFAVLRLAADGSLTGMEVVE